MKAKEIRKQYEGIEGKRHQPFVEHPLADILILTRCAEFKHWKR